MLIITILSLLMAATMGWLALRLLREEQRRSEARVAVLTAALEAPSLEPRVHPSPEPQSPVPAAPVTAAEPPPPVPEIVVVDDVDDAELFASPPPRDDRPMFGETPTDAAAWVPDGKPASDSRRWLGVAATVFVGLLGLAAVNAIWNREPAPASAATPAASTAVPGAAGIPVELVSLGHERTSDALVIRGLVRNPAAASPRVGTSASVFLFDGDGGFLGSGRAMLGTPRLGAGDEAGFEIRLPDNASVRRYRVTFRTPEGDVVPHLDRRPDAGPGAGSGLAAAKSGSGLPSR